MSSEPTSNSSKPKSSEQIFLVTKMEKETTEEVKILPKLGKKF